ncbi:uncharacterized protein LOC127253612 [Andrographis paniculata]|uniref:uncharacterized protein LOC127253612 n=1 Tax=Andrographis paniculata TaxID=175694 RepID=UPI0021E75FB9|nr:uncharacterized protein LOC127253612 [Andrographis paniculata]
MSSHCLPHGAQTIRKRGNYCGVFEWWDEEPTDRYKEVINALVSKIHRLDNIQKRNNVIDVDDDVVEVDVHENQLMKKLNLLEEGVKRMKRQNNKPPSVHIGYVKQHSSLILLNMAVIALIFLVFGFMAIINTTSPPKLAIAKG